MKTLKDYGLEMTIEKRHYLNLLKTNIKMMLLQGEDFIATKNIGAWNQGLGLALRILHQEYKDDIIKIEDDDNEN